MYPNTAVNIKQSALNGIVGVYDVKYSHGTCRDKLIYSWQYAADSPKYSKAKPTRDGVPMTTGRKRSTTDFYQPATRLPNAPKKKKCIARAPSPFVEVTALSDSENDDDDTDEIATTRSKITTATQAIMMLSMSCSCDPTRPAFVPPNNVDPMCGQRNVGDDPYDDYDEALRRIRAVAHQISASL